MKTIETEPGLASLQKLLEQSSAAAGPALAESIAYAPRRMSAAELLEFWRGARLVAMTTVGKNGQPHTAPVHAELDGTTLRVLVYEDAVRRRDLATNDRVSFTTWNGEGAAVLLYGRAREIEGSLRPARPSQSGRERRVVTVEVKLMRVHAMGAKKVCSENR
jgi:hypothetical protein